MKPIRFLPKIKRGQVCLNCDLPLAGEENFCPNCGQRNDTRGLNFGSFIHAIFSEFISYDSRLWRTIKVLLLKPGLVSRDYIDGKRFRYANPFRFYLTISIIFFILLGIVTKYEELRGTGKRLNLVDINQAGFSETGEKIINAANKKIDSLKIANPNNKDIQAFDLDSIIKKNQVSNNDFNLSFDSISFGKNNMAFAKKIAKYNKFYKNHKTLSVEAALDSLGDPHNFRNRFYYTKIRDIYIIRADKGNSLNKKIVSNLSIALFVFLPIFTLFLKLFYIRRRLNYMEHLVFVFNTQSVFFLLMILVLGVSLVSESKRSMPIFIFMFLIYLYLALLKFYKQGWFKTFVKFSIFNMVYLTLSLIGLIIVSFLAFLID